MSLLSQLFGRESSPSGDGAAQRVGLQLLFPDALPLDADALTRALRDYHPSLSEAVFQVETGLAGEGALAGIAVWGDHVVDVVGFPAPMPGEPVETCVQPAHYTAEIKERARRHRAHALLFYGGKQTDPLERYVALAAVAGALAAVTDVVVLNEVAHTSVHGSLLTPGPEHGDRLDWLRGLPLLLLYCGFVKITVAETPGVWMRTYGNHVFGLPDLAYRSSGHHEGQTTFEMFSSILDYQRDGGTPLGAGHTMQVGADVFLRAREPEPEEYFLDSRGTLLVTEWIAPDEVNRP
jgi:hypothetical protein